MNKKYKLKREYNSITTIIQKFEKEVIQFKEERPELYDGVEYI